MRIVKSQAIAALRREASDLRMQGRRCQREVDRLSRLSLGGMAGKAAATAERNLRMEAAVARAHMAFCQDLAAADSRNAQLVQGLPTTSAGVLDTSVAQDRVCRARAQVAALERRRDRALAQAERLNAAAREKGLPNPIDVGALRRRYATLVSAQQAVATLNELVIDRARRYEHDVAGIYHGVSTATLRQAHSSARSFAATGGWGEVGWAGRLQMDGLVRSYRREANRPAAPDALQRFMTGNLKTGDQIAGGRLDGSTNVGGTDVTGSLSGSLLGFAFSVKPLAKETEKDNDGSTRNTSLGATAKAECYGFKGTADLQASVLDVSNTLTVGAGVASGSLGASLYKDGAFDLSLVVAGEVSTTLVADEASVQAGVSDYNCHVRARGEGLTTSAEAGVRLGDGAVEVKAGAEAYLAKGALTGGITFLGITVDATVEAKVGGGGANLGVEADTSSVAGALGIGLGVGVSAKLKVDWSGAVAAMGRAANAIGSWWDDLWSRGGE